MKKKFFTIVIVGMMIWGCDKNDAAQMVNTNPTPNSINSLEKERIDPIDCSTKRCPDSWDRCAASCLYSSLCYCWDSYLYLGACECTPGGLARFILKVRPLPASPSAYASAEKGVNVRIILNTKNFEELLNFMESIDIKIKELREFYREILKASTKNEKSESVTVPFVEYEKFLSVYDSFLADLGESETRKVLAYIDKKSREAGLY